MKGYGFYLAILAIIFVTVILSEIDFNNKNAYNYTRFVNDVNEGKVSFVNIYPNQEVYTGEVKVSFVGKDQKQSFNVSDIREVESFLYESGVEYNTHKISKPNWFLSTILPYLLILLGNCLVFLLVKPGFCWW